MISQNISKILFSLFVLFTFSFYAQVDETDYNCFSILVGSEATVDGSVMLAHNEDDGGNRVVNWYRVPQLETNKKDFITLKRGAKVPQIDMTNSYLWFEIPELEFSDTYMNELGITITSDGCSSKEDKPELTDGGIGYWLRRLMIERSFTAKEAVQIGGELVEKYGYASSGRTYAIAGPYETWLFSVVNGKHWVAQRVPDNEVAIIPNYYTIREIDLFDTKNFLGSPDIVEYAIDRGWYDPEKDGAFNFRKAYAKESTLASRSNIARHWVALNKLSKEQYKFDEDFPFSFQPKQKIKLKDLFNVLRNHYEHTELDETKLYTKGNPHKQAKMSICSNTNQYGFVAQLRNWMPAEMGAVLWMAPSRPCANPFVPIYLGILKTPERFAINTYEKALQIHFDKLDVFYPYREHYHINTLHRSKMIDNDYKKNIIKVKTKLTEIEDNYLVNQERFEKKMLKIYIDDFDKTRKKLTEYSIQAVEELFKE